jgi:hypothetical protein
MQIIYINNDGAGFADHIDIESETTITKFFEQKVKGRANDYLIRVNRQPVASDYVLQPNDRVSITPVKIEGAVLEDAVIEGSSS